MRRRLDLLVKKELFTKGSCPQKINKRFFPRLKTIHSHMLEAFKKYRYSKIDQERLMKKMGQWKNDNPKEEMYFRLKVSCGDKISIEEGRLSVK